MVIDSVFLSFAVLVTTAAVLFYAALTDLKQFTISNELIVALALLFALYTVTTGHWSELPWNIGFATMIFVILICFYAVGWMGGGDVKLLTVAMLWTGIHSALPFAFLLLIFSSIHSVASYLIRAGTQADSSSGGMRIPFAPSIAAALVSVFMLGYLQTPYRF